MKEISLDSWKDFPKTISEIREKYGTYQVDEVDPDNVCSNVLFRGQANSDWGLDTTLEREGVRSVPVSRYYAYISESVNAIESFTDKQWDVESWPKIRVYLDKRAEEFLSLPSLPEVGFLIYLRHHGFPSPLLDWTSSPYVAAYFAIESAVENTCCSVFAFIEYPKGFKKSRGDGKCVQELGSYVTTHRRHYLQKANYTYSTLLRDDPETNRKRFHFCSHNDFTRSDSEEQDIFIKINFPVKDRFKMLNELRDYNIDHYTLFHDESSLIRSIWHKLEK